jgi:ABC-type polysaccharide/polyol phosphate transport system ATPase subunit
MSDIVIRAEALGKKYSIGHNAERERYVALRDIIGRNFRGLARSASDMLKGRPIIVGDEIEEFWALKDVNFEVRNGAGKSTLLKILSRITEPSTGRVIIEGRVASLLEVGTGFHPELTGRENIYLNGAILGMTRGEIRRKFDEIVSFAEVEKFLDTPVKRYSNGMYVRLAFAVAAHLEPEILIVDEVLAVGDSEFQKKCLGRMGEVSASGRTVLFVSHNLGALLSTCTSGMLLEAGRLTLCGSIQSIARTYQARGKNRSRALDSTVFAGPLQAIHFDHLLVNGTSAFPYVNVKPSEDLTLLVQGQADTAIADFRFSFGLYSEGTRLLTMHDGPEKLEQGDFEFTVSIPAYLLRPGEYSIALGGYRRLGGDWIWATEVASFEVLPEWGEYFDMDDTGLINLPKGLVRVRRKSPGPVSAAARAPNVV